MMLHYPNLAPGLHLKLYKWINCDLNCLEQLDQDLVFSQDDLKDDIRQ